MVTGRGFCQEWQEKYTITEEEKKHFKEEVATSIDLS